MGPMIFTLEGKGERQIRQKKLTTETGLIKTTSAVLCKGG